MAASAIRSMPTRSAEDCFSGLLLALGAVALFIGTLFYARLPPELGLPALPAERTQALADVVAQGPERLALAGGWAFAGDCLLLAASIGLAARAARSARDLELGGWALIAVSVVIALVFDSMTAALFWPLAQASDPASFLAFKAWFDFLFAAGNAPFGIGFIAVLSADTRSGSSLLPRPLTAVGFVIGAAAASSGLGYVTGLVHAPLVVGLSVTFGCLVMAALGVRILLRGRRSVAEP